MIRLSPAVQSAIEVDVIDGADPALADDYDSIREHFTGRALRVPEARESRIALLDSVRSLTNAHDDTAEDKSRSPDERRFARLAIRSLETVSAKLLATVR